MSHHQSSGSSSGHTGSTHSASKGASGTHVKPSHTHAIHSTANADFLKQAVAAAKISESKTGVPASVTVAQAILESGWGKHHIGTAKNYFGIKAFGKPPHVNIGPVATGFVEATTHEDVHGKVIKIVARFRSYANMADSFTDHGLFLRGNSIYSKAFHDYQSTGSADQFARDIQRAGYATDHQYSHKLETIMTKHKLYQYNTLHPKHQALIHHAAISKKP